MSIIGDIRSGLASALDSIDGLRVYATPPESISEFPAAIVDVRLVNYYPDPPNDCITGSREVLVLVSRPGDATEGWADVDAYASPSGGQSISAAVAADATRGGAVTTAQVAVLEQAGPVAWQGAAYQGARFMVTFHAPNT